jgi:gluconokinase
MIIIVMGVTGAGKSTIGRLLAEQLAWQFVDADDYHTQANIEKIRQGVPLNDHDRQPWLQQLRAAITVWQSQARNVVLACSALKRSYRNELSVGDEVRFVYLHGSRELVTQRLRSRTGHFADDHILAGQFADLEEPKDAVRVDICQTPEQIVAEVRKTLEV